MPVALKPKARKYVSGQAANRNSAGRKKWLEADGHKFPTAKERNRYLHLKLMLNTGHIERLELQKRFPIVIDGQFLYIQPPEVTRRRPLEYKADFVYFEVKPDGSKRYVVEDVKGKPTKEYAIKKALVEAIYHVTITEV